MNVVCFRPGCARRQTAFENQLLLYSCLQEMYGWTFTIVVDDESFEEDLRFRWVVLGRSKWAPFRGRRVFLGVKKKLRTLGELCSNADAILTLDPTIYPQSHLAFETARRLNVPVWFDATVTLQTEQLFNRWNRAAYRKVVKDLATCRRIFVPSPKVIERFAHLRLLSGAVPSKFRLLGHPIDTERFCVANGADDRAGDAKTILCVSRLQPEKGIAYILEGFLAIVNDLPDLQLVFLGAGPMADYVRHRTPPGLWGTRVIIREPVPHSALPAEYQSASVYVSHALETPGWEEYFGVANLEAMACGVPVVLSRSGAVPWAVRFPASPFWVEERDVTGIANALRAALAERTAAVDANRAHVIESYSLPAVAARFIAATEE